MVCLGSLEFYIIFKFGNVKNKAIASIEVESILILCFLETIIRTFIFFLFAFSRNHLKALEYIKFCFSAVSLNTIHKSISELNLYSLILLIISKKNNVLLRNFTEEYFNEISVVLNNIIQLKKDYEFSWISDLGNGKSRESYQQIKLKDITAEDLINKMFNYKETTSSENKEVEEKIYQEFENFVEEDEQNILEDFFK